PTHHPTASGGKPRRAVIAGGEIEIRKTHSQAAARRLETPLIWRQRLGNVAIQSPNVANHNGRQQQIPPSSHHAGALAPHDFWHRVFRTPTFQSDRPNRTPRLPAR